MSEVCKGKGLFSRQNAQKFPADHRSVNCPEMTKIHYKLFAISNPELRLAIKGDSIQHAVASILIVRSKIEE